MKQTAGLYHEKTSYDRLKMGGHFLDWQNQPEVFKRYEGLETVAMPREMPLPNEDLFTLYNTPFEKRPGKAVFDLAMLSRILLLTYTLTSQARHANGTFYYRSAASAGALYPTEIYVVSDGTTDLDSGLYHFSILEHSLVKLRDGHFSDAVNRFVKDSASKGHPLTFFLTAIFFRSAWKYGNRSYRYHLLDTGHVLENLHLSLKALGLPSENTFDFDDQAVNQLLGLDEDREVALAVCRVNGMTDSSKPFDPRMIDDLPETVKNASRVSLREAGVPEVLAVHTAGYHMKSGKTDFNMCNDLGTISKSRVSVPPVSMHAPALSYPETVFRRRSSRNFVAETLPVFSFNTLLNVINASDCGGTDPYARSICTGFLTSGVESIEDGFYLMDQKKGSLGLVAPGTFTGAMSHICLDQDWMGSASLHFAFMTNMALLEEAWGPRGYRYAMLTAGLMGERLYLAASALGLGCCGIGAFYDGEASRLLGLNESSRVLYVVSLGILKSMLKRDGML
jgi:SagB-type dehydrogenase family enzyme